MSRAPTIPRFPEVPGLADYLSDLSRYIGIGQANVPSTTRLQPYSGNLQALSDLVGSANTVSYFTGVEAMTLTGLTAAGRALLDDADAAAQLTTLGVSAFIKTLLDDTDAAAARATLNVGWETISTTTLAAAASYSATGLSAYRMLRVHALVVPATDAVSGLWRTDANGGASFDAGATDYTYQIMKGRAAALIADGVTSNGIYMNDTTTISNAAGIGMWFNITFTEFNKAYNGLAIWNGGYRDSTGIVNNINGAGYRVNAVARDAIQFLFSSGNISTGVITLEGFRG